MPFKPAAPLLTGSNWSTCRIVLQTCARPLRPCALQTYVSEEEEAEFMRRCHRFTRGYTLGDRPPAPRRDFATQWAQVALME